MNVYLAIIFLLVMVILGLLAVILRLRKQAHHIKLGMDEIAEDTLKELYHLSRDTGLVRGNDLIRSAGIQPDRFPMIQDELKRRGWVEIEGSTLHILPAGEKRAIELIRAHRLWERYLADKESIALEALHAEATRREHLNTSAELDQLEAQLGYPKFDPHGDPIPSRDGELQPEPRGTLLSQWPEKSPGLVTHVEDEPSALFTQLALLGLTPGALVEVDERTPGRLLVWSGRQRLALSSACLADSNRCCEAD